MTTEHHHPQFKQDLVERQTEKPDSTTSTSRSVKVVTVDPAILPKSPSDVHVGDSRRKRKAVSKHDGGDSSTSSNLQKLAVEDDMSQEDIIHKRADETEGDKTGKCPTSFVPKRYS
jgi:hypothetical protein